MLATAQTDILIVTALSLCAPLGGTKKTLARRSSSLRELAIFFRMIFGVLYQIRPFFFRYDRSHIRKCHALEYVERE